MQYVAFGEKQASRLGFGCGSVMGRVGRGESLRAMGAAWDAGVTLFDTARSYGYGEAEGLLGEFLAGRRESAVVVTKFGILSSRTAEWKRMLKPLVRGVLRAAPGLRGAVRSQVGGEMSAGHFDVGTLRASLEASLRALRTEYVDALLLHLPPVSVFAQEDLLAALSKVVAEGKVRCVGVSTDDTAVLREAVGVRRTFAVVQFPFPVLGGKALRLKLDDARMFGMVNHPFGGGALAKEAARKVEGLAKNAGVAQELREKLSGDGKQRLAEVVLGAALREAGAQVVVTSMLCEEHVYANVAAMGSERFSAEEIAMVLEMIAAP